MAKVLIAIGANLPSAAGPPRATCEAAVAAMGEAGLVVARRSRWFESPPDPPSDQPWYVNGVVAVSTDLAPPAVLARLQAIERRFDRVRSVRNAARTLDLDIVDYNGWVQPGPDAPILPHPRVQGRAFVLLPLADVEPDWRHPATGQALGELIRALPPDTVCRPLRESGEKTP